MRFSSHNLMNREMLLHAIRYDAHKHRAAFLLAAWIKEIDFKCDFT